MKGDSWHQQKFLVAFWFRALGPGYQMDSDIRASGGDLVCLWRAQTNKHGCSPSPAREGEVTEVVLGIILRAERTTHVDLLLVGEHVVYFIDAARRTLAPNPSFSLRSIVLPLLLLLGFGFGFG